MSFENSMLCIIIFYKMLYYIYIYLGAITYGNIFLESPGVTWLRDQSTIWLILYGVIDSTYDPYEADPEPWYWIFVILLLLLLFYGGDDWDLNAFL